MTIKRIVLNYANNLQIESVFNSITMVFLLCMWYAPHLGRWVWSLDPHSEPVTKPCQVLSVQGSLNSNSYDFG
jgi:hypothetical protein